MLSVNDAADAHLLASDLISLFTLKLVKVVLLTID